MIDGAGVALRGLDLWIFLEVMIGGITFREKKKKKEILGNPKSLDCQSAQLQSPLM